VRPAGPSAPGFLLRTAFLLRMALTPSQPIGQPMPIPSRNPGGKPMTRALVAALDETAPGADASNLRRIVDNLIGKAIDGDLSAIKEIFDRIDGKAPTAAAGTGSEEPTKVVFRWKGEE
jgi:hypothetical protein